MRIFQGSGFAIDLPEKCQDATSYTFLLPTEKQFTPYITVKFEKVTDKEDLAAYSEKQEKMLEKNIDDFEYIERVAGKQEGHDVIISMVQWGKGEASICQRFVYLYNIHKNYQRIYTITCTDLVDHFEHSLPIMNRIIKTFKPVNMQVYDA